MAVTCKLEGVDAALKQLAGIGKKAPAALKASIKATAGQARKIAKPSTPKATGRKGRGKKAGGFKRLSQSLSVKSWQRSGKFVSVVSWGGQPGLAGYANFLNYGAKNYTRRKILIRKDGKPTTGKLKVVGMSNAHNSRRGRHKGWGKIFWTGNKGKIEAVFLAEITKRLEKAGAK